MIYFVTGFLLLCCVAETALLIKDEGIVAGLLASAAQVRAAKGSGAVVRPAFSMICGKVKDRIPVLRRGGYTDDFVHIAFHPSGGLGDYIVSAKIVEELQAAAACRITVFCEHMEYGRAVYTPREGVDVCSYDGFEATRHSYDLALQAEHFIHVRNWNPKRLSALAPHLYQKIDCLCSHWDTVYIPVRQQWWRERLRFAQCEIFGWNRWTELRMGGVFSIEDMHITMPMDEAYRMRWEEMGLANRQYLTFNYGADKMRAEGTQIKLWPKAYYEKLLSELHRCRPGILLVQIGSGSCEKIAGADLYILGQSLELTKWVLAGSAVHIDCEGGLVHLAAQLDTRCVVMFGPTPVHMYGYAQNVNLQAEGCAYCMGFHKDWAYRCLRTGGRAACLERIKPKRVLEACLGIVDEVCTLRKM